MTTITIYENKGNLKEIPSQEIQERQEEILTNPSNFYLDTEFSPYMREFLERYELELNRETKSVETIQVSEVLGGLARLYEQIRNTIEYKGEHVLRRNAIERILKRLSWERDSVRSNLDERRTAEDLIKELIWARYLPNGSLPQEKITEVQGLIEKYLYLLENLDNTPRGVLKTQVNNWVWGIASSEIEECLDASYRELFVNLMYKWFVDHFEWVDTEITEHDKEIQIILAIHRAFTKSDDPIMRYHLLLKEYPKWPNAEKEEVQKLISDFPSIYSEIERHLDFPGNMVLYRKVQRSSAAFTILREISFNKKGDLKKLLVSKEDFEKEVRVVCEKKYKQIRKKVQTGIVRSIIYIFITKVFFAMLIEIPYEIFRFRDVRYIPLFINMFFPPFMMFFISLSIKVPGAKNTEEIIQKLRSVIYSQPAHTKIPFSIKKSGRNSTLTIIFSIFYFFLLMVVFGSITWLLVLLKYSIFGIGVFFFFLSLVIFFAFRVRYNSLQLKVEGEKENIISHLIGYFTLPFLNLGFYLSRGLSRLNFLNIILDFLIEVPLKNVLEVFEDWIRFLREKKEEVVEIPE